ncbi:MAG: hypothetical protein NTV98_01805, partial [Candidatus Roizmanbacteria bacterium]|nr:hypothetical protein [Candidatus Roizmanbacteria bacterium]
MSGPEGKVNFFPKKGEKLLTNKNLFETIAHANGKFPHVLHGSLVTSGELGKSGVVISNPDGPIVAAVRHMDWIPASIHGENVVFRNKQHTGHVERSFLVKRTDDQVQRHAKGMLAGL